MKLVVLSDSHGNFDMVQRIVEENPDADRFLHLGDGMREFDDVQTLFPNFEFVGVSGNCDGWNSHPSSIRFTMGGFSFFVCHGHAYAVKQGLDQLSAYAALNGFHVALFGHTHRAADEIVGRCRLVNPGSVSLPVRGGAGYAVITVEDGQLSVEPVLL